MYTYATCNWCYASNSLQASHALVIICISLYICSNFSNDWLMTVSGLVQWTLLIESTNTKCNRYDGRYKAWKESNSDDCWHRQRGRYHSQECLLVSQIIIIRIFGVTITFITSITTVVNSITMRGLVYAPQVITVEAISSAYCYHACYQYNLMLELLIIVHACRYYIGTHGIVCVCVIQCNGYYRRCDQAYNNIIVLLKGFNISL